MMTAAAKTTNWCGDVSEVPVSLDNLADDTACSAQRTDSWTSDCKNGWFCALRMTRKSSRAVVRDLIDPCSLRSMMPHSSARRSSSADDARGADSVWRRVLGMDAKLRQYREGAAFVRAVVNDGGMAAMNRVWADPGNVPTLGEIREPSLWLDRMRGAAA